MYCRGPLFESIPVSARYVDTQIHAQYPCSVVEATSMGDSACHLALVAQEASASPPFGLCQQDRFQPTPGARFDEVCTTYKAARRSLLVNDKLGEIRSYFTFGYYCFQPVEVSRPKFAPFSLDGLQ
jgi:hypothetical protein